MGLDGQRDLFKGTEENKGDLRIIWAGFVGGVQGYPSISNFPGTYAGTYPRTLPLLDIPSYTDMYMFPFPMLLYMVGCPGIFTGIQALCFLRKLPYFIDGHWI